MQRPHVTILGMQGVGKSTVGHIVAERAGLDHLDGDAALTALTGKTAGELAAAEGVPALHELEAELATAALESDEPAVVTPAASVLDDETVIDLIRRRSRLVVVLEAESSVLASRVEPDDHRREMTANELARRWAARRPTAVSIADLLLDATNEPTSLAESIASIRSC